jgi:hypothetical protein
VLPGKEVGEALQSQRPGSGLHFASTRERDEERDKSSGQRDRDGEREEFQNHLVGHEPTLLTEGRQNHCTLGQYEWAIGTPRTMRNARAGSSKLPRVQSLLRLVHVARSVTRPAGIVTTRRHGRGIVRQNLPRAAALLLPRQTSCASASSSSPLPA